MPAAARKYGRRVATHEAAVVQVTGQNSLREGHRLGVLENRALRGAFGQREGVK
jgi:hypothetical protein